MGKHTDAVKPFAEFRAPWETEAGEDAEIDKSKLKRYIHNLVNDKAKAQDARDETDEALKTAETELETAKAEAADANGADAQKKIDKLQAKVDELTNAAKERDAADEAAELRKEVLGDLEEKYAKYVKGDTREELEKSLEAVREDFNLGDGSDDEDGDEDDEPVVRNRPRSKGLRNAADPEGGKGGGESYDPEKVADQILGNNIWG